MDHAAGGVAGFFECALFKFDAVHDTGLAHFFDEHGQVVLDVLYGDGSSFGGFLATLADLGASWDQEVFLAKPASGPKSNAKHVQVDQPVIMDVQHGHLEAPAQLAESRGAHLHLVAEPGLVDPSESTAQAERHTFALLVHALPLSLAGSLLAL